MICSDCPRKCGAERCDEQCGGVCMSPSLPRIARAAPHFGEEPCISGSRGSGAIFFTGCNLKCVFCQNYEISRGRLGETVSVLRLSEIFRELEDKGVHNINLVTASHYVSPVIEALGLYKPSIPIVWNSSGYESVETLKRLEGLVDIYMPDMKYLDSELARRYSLAADYPEAASAAIREMLRQTGDYVLSEDGMLKSGVLIRHLILPEAEENSRAVIDFVSGFHNRVLFSLMSQFTPMPDAEKYPELMYRVKPMMYARLCDYAIEKGISAGFFQGEESACDEMIPEFDLTGIRNKKGEEE